MTTMADPAVANNDDTPDGFKFKNVGKAPSAMQEHGAQFVEETLMHTMRLRVIYFIKDRTRDNFNVITWHKNFLQQLSYADSKLIIIPNDESAQYADLKLYPTEKTSWEKQFSESFTLVGAKAQRVTVCHSIKSLQTLFHLKWKTPNLMNFLKNYNITLKADNFMREVTASIGFFIKVHPHGTHRDTLRDRLEEIIVENVDLNDETFAEFITDEEKEAMNCDDMEIPRFEIQFTTVKHGGEIQTATEALDIICSKKKAPLLKEIFCSVDFTEHLKGGRFVPRGLIQMTDEDTFRTQLEIQNDYLAIHAHTFFQGMTRTAAEFKIKVATADPNNDNYSSIWELMESAKGVINVFPTEQTESHGKWSIIHKRDDELYIKSLLDDELPAMFSFLPKDKPELWLEGYSCPRRFGIRSHHGRALSYAASLRGDTTTTHGRNGPPPRPKRAPPLMTFQEGEFPGLPPSKRTNVSNTPGMNPSNAPARAPVAVEEISAMIDQRMDSKIQALDQKMDEKFKEHAKQTDNKINEVVSPLVSRLEQMDAGNKTSFNTLTGQLSQLMHGMQLQQSGHPPTPPGFHGPNFGHTTGHQYLTPTTPMYASQPPPSPGMYGGHPTNNNE
jgi:hypothetical protein